MFTNYIHNDPFPNPNVNINATTRRSNHPHLWSSTPTPRPTPAMATTPMNCHPHSHNRRMMIWGTHPRSGYHHHNHHHNHPHYRYHHYHQKRNPPLLSKSSRMESDVEEGEIRESECLSPLSEDELEQVRPVIIGHKRRRVMVSRNDRRRSSRRRSSPYHRLPSPPPPQPPPPPLPPSRHLQHIDHTKSNRQRKYGKNRKKVGVENGLRNGRSPLKRQISASRGIPDDIQDRHVIVFCDPPRSPDTVVVNSDVKMDKNYKRGKTKKEDDEVEVLTIIDKSSRVTEVIVIDSTSSSESDADTDFKEADPPSPGRVPLPDINPLLYVPPSYCRNLVPPDELTPVTSPEKLSPVKSPPPPPTPPSPPLPVKSVLEKLPVENGELNLYLPYEGDEEDLEVLELRIRALEGLMNKLPNSEPLADTTPTENAQSPSAIQKQSTPSATVATDIPDDNEKENENEMELNLLRSKLLSDLAKQKKKKEAIEMSMLNQKTDTTTRQKPPVKSNNTSKTQHQAERRNSKSTSSYSKYSRKRKYSDTSSYNKRKSSSSSASQPRPSNSTSSTAIQTPSSKWPGPSSISVSVSKDGKHRTVFSRETPLPSPKTPAVIPIVIQSPSNVNPQRIVRILDVNDAQKTNTTTSSTSSTPAKPKKGKTLSPQKQKQVPISYSGSGSSGPQKVLTKSSNGMNCRPSVKMTPFSHNGGGGRVILNKQHQSPNEFSITRTIVNQNAFKAKYSNARKNYNRAINNSTSRGPPKKVQPIVIQLRNNDESTDDEDNDDAEDENIQVEDEPAANTLPKGFHSSLDKFLKSVRESASKNGLTGNPCLQNATTLDKPITLTPPDNNSSSSITEGETFQVIQNIPLPSPDGVSSEISTATENIPVPSPSPVSSVDLEVAIIDKSQSFSPDSITSSTSIQDEASVRKSSVSPPSVSQLGHGITDITEGKMCHKDNHRNCAVVTENVSDSLPNADKTESIFTFSENQLKTMPSLKSLKPATSPSGPIISALDDRALKNISPSLESGLATSSTLNTTTTAATPVNRNISKSPRKDQTGESLAHQFTRTREELQLREKILRATFKKSETKIKLTRTEKEFLTSRKSATNFLENAIDKINQHSDKLTQCLRIEQQVEKLQKQLQVAERSLYVKNIEAAALHQDAVSIISKAFDMRANSVTFGIECKKLGNELNGELYKIPSTGAGDMLAKFKEIYKLTTKDELKKGPINFKKLQEQIITSLNRNKSSNTPITSSSTRSIHLESPSESNSLHPISGRSVVGKTQQELETQVKITDIHLPLPVLSPLSNSVEIELSSTFVPYVSCWIPSSVQSNIDCNAVVCPHIVLHSCNSHNCKFQHLPDPRNDKRPD